MKIAVQMDPPARLNPRTDTTFSLIEAAGRRGHTVSYYTPDSLSWRMGEITAALAPIAVDYAATPVYSVGETSLDALSDYDIVLMRQDPPFDMGYITATHLLERLPPSVAVWNKPAAVRNAPEKLSVLGFAQFMPPTLISRNAEEIHGFARAQGTIVAKPLYGFGGRSVFKLASADSNIETLIEHWREQSNEPLMWQAFLPQVAREDKRVLFIDGEIVAVFARIPADGSIRANMRVGGTAAKTTLTPRQQEITAALSPFLKSSGLLLAGIDLIGDYLTEINVTCPTGLRAADALYGTHLATNFWDAVEAKPRAS